MDEEGGLGGLRGVRPSSLSPPPPLLLLPPPPPPPLNSHGPSHSHPPTLSSMVDTPLPYHLTPLSEIPSSLVTLPSYGLPSPLPHNLQGEFKDYEAYRMEAFNLNRDAKRAKEVTIMVEIKLLSGYLGFARRLDRSIVFVDLNLCLKPTKIMAFISFLLARGLKRGTIINHIKAILNMVKYMKYRREREREVSAISVREVWGLVVRLLATSPSILLQMK